jgi:membrane-bound ClpP family serine protease
MDILIITVLLVAATLLLLVELFLLPGVSVAGFLSAGAYLFAIYYAFTYVGTGTGFLTLGIAAVLSIGSIIWFMHSKTLDRVSLKKSITSKVDRSAADKVKVGDTGIAITRLALIGNAEIDGNIVEVKSADGFLMEKTPIIVTRIMDGIIMVEKVSD